MPSDIRGLYAIRLTRRHFAYQLTREQHRLSSLLVMNVAVSQPRNAAKDWSWSQSMFAYKIILSA